MKQIFTRLKKAVGQDPHALSDLERAEQIQERSEELLRVCQAQVGMVTGEEIAELLADMNNQQFNGRDYHYERLPEGQ